MENKVLAMVNGREITERDLQQMIVKIPNERQSYVKTEEGRRQLLEEMVCFELIYNHAKDDKIEEEKDFIDQLEIIKKDLLTQYTIGKLLSEVTISDEEIEEYYNNNKEKFKTEESIVAKHILVATLEEAEKSLEEIEKGMSFEEAAEKFSTCPSKSSGGNLGTFGRGRMVPEFEKAAFELEIGVVSEPVKTQFGYHIIKVEHKNQPFIIPFNKMKESIEFDLKQEAQRNKYFEITNELKRTYKVEIK